MEKVITDHVFRKILMLDYLEGEKTIHHDLLTDYNHHNYIFIGPKHCGKTSSLFELAFQAAEHDHNVLFVTRKRLEKLPHFINTREQPRITKLKLIEILYLDTVEEYLQVMATMHMRKKKYSLLLVDGIDEYCLLMNKHSIGIAGRICAFTCDAVAYLRKCGLDTMLVCSMTSDLKKPTHSIQKVMEDWMPNVVYHYPHHRRNGFTIKSNSNVPRVIDDDDVDVMGVRSEFNGGNIVLH